LARPAVCPDPPDHEHPSAERANQNYDDGEASEGPSSTIRKPYQNAGRQVCGGKDRKNLAELPVGSAHARSPIAGFAEGRPSFLGRRLYFIHVSTLASSFHSGKYMPKRHEKEHGDKAAIDPW
jgi:hypothetical protein